jgi:hypothetical protein
MSPGLVRRACPARERRGPAARPAEPRRRSAVGNQAGLARLRASGGEARPRCEGSGSCQSDEGRKRDPSGIATCNPSTGAVETTVFGEQCVGDCIARHEATHAKDDSACCATYANCMKTASNAGQRADCQDKWLQYAAANDAYTECNAYTVEQQCMTDLIAQNCGKDGKAGKDCCDKLKTEKATVDKRQQAYCGGPNGPPVPMPCGLYFKQPATPPGNP